MIRKSKDSEIFDLYVESMLKKDAAGVGKEVSKNAPVLIDLATGVANPLIPGAVKDVAKDVAKGLGGASEAVPAAAPAAAKTVQDSVPTVIDEAIPAGKVSQEVTNAGIYVKRLFSDIDDLTVAFKEMITEGAIKTSRYQKYSAEDLLAEFRKIMNPGGRLDSAMSELNNLKGLKNVAEMKNALEGSVERLLESHSLFKKHMDGIAAGAKTVPEGVTDAAGVATEVGDAVGDATKGAPAVTDAAAEAARLAAEKAAKEGAATVANLEAKIGELTKTSKATTERLMKDAKDLGKAKALLEEALKKTGDDAAAQIKIHEDIVEKLTAQVEGLTARVASGAADPAKAKAAVAEAARLAAEKAAKEMAEEIAASKKGLEPKGFGGSFGETSGKTLGELSSKWGFGLVAGGTAIASLYFLVQHFRTPGAKELTTNLENALNRGIVELGKLKFAEGRDGQLTTNELIDDYRVGLANAPRIQATLDLEELISLNNIFEEVKSGSIEYIEEEAEIAQFLIDSTNWETAKEAVQAVTAIITEIAEELLASTERERARAAAAGEEPFQPSEEDRASEIMRMERERDGGGSGEGRNTDGPGGSDSIVTSVPGTNIQLDYQNAPIQSAGFRSAAPRILKKVLSSPVGLAFMDPEGAVWTGVLSRENRLPTERDYWRALGYLYQHGISSAGQLRRYMRDFLERKDRRRYSAWNEALKYYRGSVSNKYSASIYHNNIGKTANLSLLNETSDNRSSFMRKFADEFSNSYVQDAIKGLSDEYAKSYFSGLKSMYDDRLGSSDADFAELYRPLGGTGAELIGVAHPESLTIAESMGKGGLVENVIEQQRANIDVALSAPSGNFRGKHANVKLINALVKIANDADLDGNIEVSNLIDEVLSELTN